MFRTVLLKLASCSLHVTLRCLALAMVWMTVSGTAAAFFPGNKVHPVPEIDANLAFSGATLLMGGILILTDRYSRRNKQD